MIGGQRERERERERYIYIYIERDSKPTKPETLNHLSPNRKKTVNPKR